MHVVKVTTVTVEKKPLALVLPCLGSISLQTRTKLEKPLKNILNCCKLQISSNINEGIRAVIFSKRNDFTRTKSTKSQISEKNKKGSVFMRLKNI